MGLVLPGEHEGDNRLTVVSRSADCIDRDGLWYGNFPVMNLLSHLEDDFVSQSVRWGFGGFRRHFEHEQQVPESAISALSWHFTDIIRFYIIREADCVCNREGDPGLLAEFCWDFYQNAVFYCVTPGVGGDDGTEEINGFGHQFTSLIGEQRLFAWMSSSLTSLGLASRSI